MKEFLTVSFPFFLFALAFMLRNKLLVSNWALAKTIFIQQIFWLKLNVCVSIYNGMNAVANYKYGIEVCHIPLTGTI